MLGEEAPAPTDIPGSKQTFSLQMNIYCSSSQTKQNKTDWWKIGNTLEEAETTFEGLRGMISAVSS